MVSVRQVEKREDTRTLDDMANELRNDIYAVAVAYCERAEHRGLVSGNGHHMAQNIAEAASRALLAQRWRERP